jgi:hypothetical protein
MITAKTIGVSLNTTSNQKWTMQYEVNYEKSLTPVKVLKTNNINRNSAVTRTENCNN